MLREDDPEARSPQAGDRGVHERRVVMAMNHACLMLRCDSRDSAAQTGLKSFTPTKCGDADVLVPESCSPAAFLIQAADGHRQLRPQAPYELDDESLRSTGIEAQHYLKDLQGLTAVCRHCWHFCGSEEQGCVQLWKTSHKLPLPRKHENTKGIDSGSW